MYFGIAPASAWAARPPVRAREQASTATPVARVLVFTRSLIHNLEPRFARDHVIPVTSIESAGQMTVSDEVDPNPLPSAGDARETSARR
ncbi:hypothetical protein GCM10018965_034730 [Nonomuraea roseola]